MQIAPYIVDLRTVGTYVQNTKYIPMNMNDAEKVWVIEQIGSITASNGNVFVKELYKNIIPKDFPHQQIARQVCKIKKKDLEQ